MNGNLKTFWKKKVFEGFKAPDIKLDDEMFYKFKAKCGDIEVDFTMSTYVYNNTLV